MKTAMQELLDMVRVRRKNSVALSLPSDEYAMDEMERLINRLLPKEKQDIIDAYKVGFSFGEDIPDNHANFMATDYFTQKYEQ